MSPLRQRLAAVHARIEQAAARHGRAAADIALVAVSKTRPAEDIAAAHAAGQRAFGENYVQEALGKIRALAGHELEWHFIGPIQSNKTKELAAHFDWVHSIDRLKVAQRLDRQRPPGCAPLQVCLQVNISGEASKAGVVPEELEELARAVAGLPRLRLRGLMAIPAAQTDLERQRAPFGRLRQALERLNRAGLALDTLSMGMSGDLEAAVAEGATLLRIGSAIFGERPRQR